MDVSSPGIGGVAVVTVICFLAGRLVEATGLDNRRIPVIVGAPGMLVMPDFPAADCMTAAAAGVVSGLAATGVRQAYKRLNKGE
ncbi:phage holin family protein [Pseudoflavonifractor phocaeensis]|uniref:phage holin family protein n=1 Tax=Pseudoflavonifractor phocaeensis TaxID=1870988 RepID=UPI00210ED254|nr:phage holin family protein [Pseudoflavonifractor phocaeensis]MCQ4865580.1 phage holin family protein [Pseudoflavonifractor phocaeensis]